MSEVSKGFSLFRLPAIPLTKISQYMYLEEIFKLSLASKKSAYIIGSLLPPNLFELEIELAEESKASVYAERHWHSLFFKHTGVHRYQGCLAVAQHFLDVCLQWARSDSVKSMLTHFAIVFNPTISITFGNICRQEFVMDVLNHVKQLNLVFTSLKIYASTSPENYKYILDVCKNIPRLWLFWGASPDFEYRAGPDFRVNDFVVRDGHWMHLEDFVNCKKVTIYHRNNYKQESYANPEVPRALIRKWIESDSQLEQFSVYSYPSSFDCRLTLQGLEYRTIEQTENSHIVEITRRCDGKKATIECGCDYFELKVVD